MTGLELAIKLSDHTLVDACKNGCKKAFGELYARYRYRIFCKILSMCGNHIDAEDITQDVFASVLENIQKIRGDSSFFTYLCGVAIHQVQRYHKNKTKNNHRKINGKIRIVKLEDEDVLPNRHEVSAEDKDEFRYALDCINTIPHYGIAVLLSDVGEKTTEEISEILNIKQGTIKSRINRGRSQLKEMMRRSHVAR